MMFLLPRKAEIVGTVTYERKVGVFDGITHAPNSRPHRGLNLTTAVPAELGGAPNRYAVPAHTTQNEYETDELEGPNTTRSLR